MGAESTAIANRTSVAPEPHTNDKLQIYETLEFNEDSLDHLGQDEDVDENDPELLVHLATNLLIL